MYCVKMRFKCNVRHIGPRKWIVWQNCSFLLVLICPYLYIACIVLCKNEEHSNRKMGRNRMYIIRCILRLLTSQTKASNRQQAGKQSWCWRGSEFCDSIFIISRTFFLAMHLTYTSFHPTANFRININRQKSHLNRREQ